MIKREARLPFLFLCNSGFKINVYFNLGNSPHKLELATDKIKSAWH